MTDRSVLEHATATETPRTNAGDGDHDRFAHYVRKAELDKALFSGVPATAVCGKKWLPSKDPKRFPVCPTCKDLYGQMRPGDPDNPDYGS